MKAGTTPAVAESRRTFQRVIVAGGRHALASARTSAFFSSIKEAPICSLNCLRCTAVTVSVASGPSGGGSIRSRLSLAAAASVQMTSATLPGGRPSTARSSTSACSVSPSVKETPPGWTLAESKMSRSPPSSSGACTLKCSRTTEPSRASSPEPEVVTVRIIVFFLSNETSCGLRYSMGHMERLIRSSFDMVFKAAETTN
mmetsp:Transcript_33697/g.100268  ORF Transcript_33697/g.100268 Transcript_33697/m.100268 type:complete len:200 (-) Transcript_33697:18-617(-)